MTVRPTAGTESAGGGTVARRRADFKFFPSRTGSLRRPRAGGPPVTGPGPVMDRTVSVTGTVTVKAVVHGYDSGLAACGAASVTAATVNVTGTVTVTVTQPRRLIIRRMLKLRSPPQARMTETQTSCHNETGVSGDSDWDPGPGPAWLSHWHESDSADGLGIRLRA